MRPNTLNDLWTEIQSIFSKKYQLLYNLMGFILRIDRECMNSVHMSMSNTILLYNDQASVWKEFVFMWYQVSKNKQYDLDYLYNLMKTVEIELGYTK